MYSTGMDNITNLLGAFLDVQSRRSQVVAGNLANADTPGYVAKELHFADFLKQAATQALSPAIFKQPSIGAQLEIGEQTPATIGIDGNTVDAAREMSTLSEAGLKYLEGTQLLQMRLRTLRLAIREGR